jgi:hypothetical protein
MGQTQWTQFLSEVLRLDVRIEYERGVPKSYSFQLSGYVDDEWVDLVRYDTSHGAPHRHISYPDGNVEYMPFVAVLPVTFVGWVQRDMQEHAHGYFEEYVRRLSNMKAGE